MAKRNRPKKKLTKAVVPILSTMTQFELVFFSGVRKQKIILHADIMLAASASNNLRPTICVAIRKSTAKNVIAMVTNVRHGTTS
jgi:hypothetical protein